MQKTKIVIIIMIIMKIELQTGISWSCFSVAQLWFVFCLFLFLFFLSFCKVCLLQTFFGSLTLRLAEVNVCWGLCKALGLAFSCSIRCMLRLSLGLFSLFVVPLIYINLYSCCSCVLYPKKSDRVSARRARHAARSCGKSKQFIGLTNLSSY